MQTNLFSATGTKLKAITLPDSLFAAPINEGLMHQALVRQQSNRRRSTAHTKSRGEVQGSTKKMFAQKHTGRARRGSIHAAGLRGGGKAFGSKKNRNYVVDMPQKMRQAALRSCLSFQAKKEGTIIVLENYPDTIKTRTVVELLGKLPVELGRRILLVTSTSHAALHLSSRNIVGVKTITAPYLNPEDVLGSKYLIFVEDAIETADKVFGKKAEEKELKKKNVEKKEEKKETKTAKPAARKVTKAKPKTTTAKKATKPAKSSTPTS